MFFVPSKSTAIKNKRTKTIGAVEKRFAMKNKINEFKKKVCIRNLKLETSDQHSSFFRLFGSRYSSPKEAFSFNEGMRPNIEITRNRAVTFPSQQAAHHFMKRFIYILQALDSDDPMDSLIKKVNDKSCKLVKIVSIELEILKALEGNYCHLKLLAKK